MRLVQKGLYQAANIEVSELTTVMMNDTLILNLKRKTPKKYMYVPNNRKLNKGIHPNDVDYIHPNDVDSIHSSHPDDVDYIHHSYQ